MKKAFDFSEWRKSLRPAKLGLAMFMLLCAAAVGWAWVSQEEQGINAAAKIDTALQQLPAESLPGPEAGDDADRLSPEEQAAAASAAYFAAYRMDREQARAEELALLQRIVDDPGGSPAIREEAEQRRLAVAASVEQEARAESLLSAKGFGETVVLNGADRATVIVAVEMDEQKAAQIAEIVDSACACGFENVVIVNR